MVSRVGFLTISRLSAVARMLLRVGLPRHRLARPEVYHAAGRCTARRSIRSSNRSAKLSAKVLTRGNTFLLYAPHGRVAMWAGACGWNLGV
jgi:hypothetical protein